MDIHPDTEIGEKETYHVNLLGLLPANFADDQSKANSIIDAYADIMREAGMEVRSAVRSEDKITVAAMRDFKRLYYDDLSFRGKGPLPPEVATPF